MEKYAKLLKGLEVCAGPECCKDGCPYYNTTTGGMTCRARLLLDASVAIMNERSSAVAALQDRDAVEKENDVLRERCREKDKLTEPLEEDKTDRPSACDKELMQEVGKLIGQAKYQEGRADALAAIVERCSFGGGCRHE